MIITKTEASLETNESLQQNRPSKTVELKGSEKFSQDELSSKQKIEGQIQIQRDQLEEEERQRAKTASTTVKESYKIGEKVENQSSKLLSA